jgi:toxin YoeB
MVGKKIIWSIRADYELKKNLKFYNERNGSIEYSLKLLVEIDDLMNTLSKSEFIGRLTINKKTRVVVMKRFLIFYEINTNIIQILSFWDNRQNNRNRIEI